MISAHSLQQRLIAKQVIPIELAGNKLLLDSLGVLAWPKQNLIIFSDLHLEKGSFLSQFANPLPRFDSADTLQRMQQAMSIYQGANVVCLGDSLHDVNALSRMQKNDLACLNTLVESVNEFTWVQGNHDPDIPDAIKGVRAEQLKLANLLLVHEPEDLSLLADSDNIAAQIVGHFHPKSTHRITNRKFTGKCFLQGESVLFMPAFGSYTGGLDSTHSVFENLLCTKTMSTYLLYKQQIFRL